MLAKLIGSVDMNSAAVLCVLFITICIISTTSIAKRRSRRAMDQDFELAKIKQADEQKARLFGLDTQRAVEIGKLEKNLITSHREGAPRQDS